MGRESRGVGEVLVEDGEGERGGKQELTIYVDGSQYIATISLKVQYVTSSP